MEIKSEGKREMDLTLQSPGGCTKGHPSLGMWHLIQFFKNSHNIYNRLCSFSAYDPKPFEVQI
jgi:hypothetical protein